MEMSKKEFGERIKMYREQNNMTQKELADGLGLSQSAIAKYENGERLVKFEFMHKLSDFFGITEDELCGKVSKEYCLPTYFIKEIDNLHLTDSEYKELINYAKFLYSKRGEQ